MSSVSSSSPAQSRPKTSSVQHRVRTVTARALVDFVDPRELCQVMLDAVHAHKRLYEDAKILHGDINPNTIFIFNPDYSTQPPTSSAPLRPVGAIIDFDQPITSKHKAKHL
ncbi:hypothetical protein BC628DRAFT_1330412 [Trametes gibbosa]|nr:hypothetical protein BC628DRAFT_1330412 [Trametes gibbosa]